MNSRRPPALATWLLNPGFSKYNAALAGDLLEEFQSGRSAAWFWRQALMAIATGIGRNAVVQRPYLSAVGLGFGAQALVTYALWQLHSPPRVHSIGWGASASGWCFSGYLILAVLKGRIGSARNWCAMQKNPSIAPAITVSELASLIEEVGARSPSDVLV